MIIDSKRSRIDLELLPTRLCSHPPLAGVMLQMATRSLVHTALLLTYPQVSALSLSVGGSHELRRRRCSAPVCTASADRPPPFATAFNIPVAHGRVVAVRLPPPIETVPLPLNELHAREREAMKSMLPPRRILFAGGRVAMRRAQKAIGVGDAARNPVLSDGVGAPLFMDDVLGSISHTHGLAAAIVSAPPVWQMGACAASAFAKPGSSASGAKGTAMTYAVNSSVSVRTSSDEPTSTATAPGPWGTAI